jgi:hypothetical protein
VVLETLEKIGSRGKSPSPDRALTRGGPPAPILGAVPLFTKANAAEMARRGNLARWSRPVLLPAAPEIPATIADTAQDYRSVRLARIRSLLDRIDERLSKATDALDIDRLARASAVLSAQEFALAGRPLPGALRPSVAQARRALAVDAGPVFSLSLPAVQVSPVSPLSTVSPPAPAPAPAEAPKPPARVMPANPWRRAV